MWHIPSFWRKYLAPVTLYNVLPCQHLHFIITNQILDAIYQAIVSVIPRRQHSHLPKQHSPSAMLFVACILDLKLTSSLAGRPMNVSNNWLPRATLWPVSWDRTRTREPLYVMILRLIKASTSCLSLQASLALRVPNAVRRCHHLHQ